MRKTLLIALAVVVCLVAVFLLVVAMQPSEFRVTRSATIAAPPPDVFPHINNLRKWNEWSPWAELDPNAEDSFEGPDEGEGAVLRWAGNEEVGEGSMTITESRPYELVAMRIEFVKPYEDACDTTFKLEGDGDQTRVTWDMQGQNNFIAKAMCLFMDIDEMVGGQFEQGLANLSRAVEEARETDSSEEVAGTEQGETP